MPIPDKVLVLGLGNVLCGDDAFGVLAAARLRDLYDFPENVEIMDGGTQGQTLFGLIAEARLLLALDAANFDAPPGTLKIMRDGDIPMWLAKGKISPHQDSFAELLALASLKNCLPEQMALIGMQPQSTDFGAPVTSITRTAINQATLMSVKILSGWGIKASLARLPKTPPNECIINAMNNCFSPKP